MADTYLTIGSTGLRKKLHDNDDPDGTFSDSIHVAGSTPYPTTPIVEVYSPSGVAYMKVTPSASALELLVRPRVTTQALIFAPIIVHKIADTNVLAATNPAITEANSYALADELKSDYNTHIASLIYHVVADLGSVSLDDATDEATLVALVNSLLTLMRTHAANATAHGGQADTAFTTALGLVSACNDAPTAIALENALAAAWLNHLNVVDLGAYVTVAASLMPMVWPCLGTVFVKTDTSGGVFTVAEFRSD